MVQSRSPDARHLVYKASSPLGRTLDYTGADLTGWCLEAGFSTVDVLPLTGPASAAIALK